MNILDSEIQRSAHTEPSKGEWCSGPPDGSAMDTGYLSQTSAMPCLGGEEVSGLGSVLALGCLEAAAC